MTRTSSLWRKKLEMISKDGKIAHAHGPVGLTLKKKLTLKRSYRFSAIPIKNSPQFFTDLERTILNFTWKKQNQSRIAKTILYNERTPSLFPNCIKWVTIIKTAWYWHINMWIRGIGSKTQTQIYTHMDTWFLTKKLEIHNGKKKSFSTNGACITGYPHVEECK